MPDRKIRILIAKPGLDGHDRGTVITPVRFLAILAVFALALVGALELVGHEIEAHPGSAPYWATGSLTVSNVALAIWLLVHLRDRRRKKPGRSHG